MAPVERDSPDTATYITAKVRALVDVEAAFYGSTLAQTAGAYDIALGDPVAALEFFILCTHELDRSSMCKVARASRSARMGAT
jgi:hypothetical protein